MPYVSRLFERDSAHKRHPMAPGKARGSGARVPEDEVQARTEYLAGGDAPASRRGDVAHVQRHRNMYFPSGAYSCTRWVSSCTSFTVATMNISTAREGLPDAVELARTEAVFLERYGRLAAVLVSPEQYEKMAAALEDAEDVAAFDAAMAEEGPNIPWDEVKVDLGWT
jgi:antitoxin Phd